MPVEDLRGRVAVVTGGAGGLGRAMGQRFASEGMRVVLADVQPEPLAALIAELRAAGHDVTGVPTDVSDYDSVCALRDAALDAYGPVHVLCNNAGIGVGAEQQVVEILQRMKSNLVAAESATSTIEAKTRTNRDVGRKSARIGRTR